MSANLGSASGSIFLEVAQARQNVKALAGDLREFSGNVGNSFGGATKFIDQHEQSIRVVGQGLLGLGTIATGLFGAGLWNAANVEQAFSIMQAGTGATGAELEKLQNLALQIGKDTAFSASEAALAITELGKAGMPVETILNGAADAVVNLATAGEMDLATASTVLTNAMNQYGLSAEQATDVTNILARGAAASTADVQDLASGLTYVGTTANQLGIDLPTTTAALAALNDQGLRGSMAGTALNQMLTSIINPSAKAAGAMEELGLATGGTFSLIDESTGQMKSLPEIIQNVDAATKNLTDSERARYLNMIFGEQGGRAINALLQTQTDEAKAAGKGWEDYAEGVVSGQTAADVAAAKMDNLRGDIEQFTGGLETLAYTATKTFLPAFRTVVQAADAVLGAIIALPEPLQAIIAGLIGLVGVTALAGGGFLLMLPRISETITAFRALRTALAASSISVRGLGVALRGLVAAHPVLLAVMALVAAGILAYKTNFLGFADAINWVVDKVQGFIKTFKAMYAITSLTGKYDGPVAALRALGFAVASVINLNPKRIVDIFTEIGIAINRPIQAVKKFVAGFGEMIGAIASGDWSKSLKKFQKMIAGIGDFLDAPAKAVGQFLKSIQTGFKPLDKVLSNLGKVWTDFGRLIQEVFQGDINGALEVGKRLLRHFADYLHSLGPLIWAGVRAIANALIDGFKAIDWGAVGTFLIDGVKGAISALADAAGSIAAGAAGIWDWISDSIGEIDWGAIKDSLLDALESALSGLSAAVDWVLDTGIPALSGWITDVANDVWGGLKSLAGWVDGAIPGAIELALSVLDKLEETVLSGFTSAKDWIVDKIPWLAGPLDTAGEALSAALNLLFNVAGNVLSSLGEAWQSAKQLVSAIAGWLGDFFGIGDDGSTTSKEEVADAAMNFLFTVAGNFISTLGTAWTDVKTLIGALFGWIPDFFGIGSDGSVSGGESKEASGGTNLLFRLAGTFMSALGAAWSSIRSLISSLFGWIADFFGIGDSGDVAAAAIKSASGGFSLVLNLLGSLVSYLDGTWSSVKGLIGSVGGWLADFFGISDTGDVAGAVTKSATASFSFVTFFFGAISDFLGDGWSSVGDLVNKARHWIGDFFGIKSGSDFGQTASKTAKAALTLATEFGEEITDNLSADWDSVKSLVKSVASAAGDLVDDAWGGVKKTVESTVDIVVAVSGEVSGAVGSLFEFIFGGGGSEASAPAVSLEQRIGEIVTSIETGLQQIADAFTGFDATGHVTGLNDDLVAAFGNMSGDSIGAAAKAWVERGLAKIGEGITSDSLMTIPRSLDTSLSGAFGMMSGDSISGGIKGWLSRAVALAAIGIDGLGLALARSVDTAAGPGFAALSGDSLSAGIRGWLARAVAVTATQLDVLGQSFATSFNTAGMSGFGTLSGESLSSAIVGWLNRAQTTASTTINMSTLATGVATKLQQAISPKLTQIVTDFRTFAGNVTTEMQRLQTNASREMSTAASNLRRHASDARTNVQSAFRDIESSARTMASGVSREASRAGSDLASQLRQGANQARSAMSGAMNEIIGIVQNAAGRMRSAGYSVGSAAGDGVAAGLNASLGAVRSAAQGIIDEVDRAMRAKAKIASPSKLTTWIGQMLGEGPVVGMLDKLRDVRRAAALLMEAAIPEIDRRALDMGVGNYIADRLAMQRRFEAATVMAGSSGPAIGNQYIEMNVTQAPGEDGEAFANRVVSLLVDAYDGVNGLGV